MSSYGAKGTWTPKGRSRLAQVGFALPARVCSWLLGIVSCGPKVQLRARATKLTFDTCSGPMPSVSEAWQLTLPANGKPPARKSAGCVGLRGSYDLAAASPTGVLRTATETP
jgi:hypothetical protein